MLLTLFSVSHAKTLLIEQSMRRETSLINSFLVCNAFMRTARVNKQIWNLKGGRRFYIFRVEQSKNAGEKRHVIHFGLIKRWLCVEKRNKRDFVPKVRMDTRDGT